MPFKKIGPNSYVSPSGRKFTAAQVRLYYATNGFQDKPKGKTSASNKRKNVQPKAKPRSSGKGKGRR